MTTKRILFATLVAFLGIGSIFGIASKIDQVKTPDVSFGSATVLTVPQGGTGQSSLTRGDILIATSTTAFAKIGAGSVTQTLTMVNGFPTWADPVKTYCATVGPANADYITDGTADDVQINQAETACAGKAIKILSGTYDITAPIITSSGTVTEGSGSSTLLKVNASMSGSLNAITNTYSASGDSRISLSNFFIDGNRQNRSGTYGNEAGHNIMLTNASSSVIYGITSINAYGANIVVARGSNHNIIKGNFTSGAGTHGILVVGRDDPVYTYENIVEGNVVENSGDAFGVGLEIAVNALRNTVIGNYSARNKEGGVHVFLYSNYNKIIGNTLIGNNQNGISIVDESSYNIISNNQILDSANVGISATTYLLTSGGNHNSILGNVIHGSGWNGMRGSFSDSIIKDNNIDHNGQSATSTSLKYGAYLTAASHLNFSGNRVTDSFTNGVVTIDQQYMTFSNNYVASSTNVGASFEVSITGTVESTISGNTFENNGGNGAVFLSQTKRSTITGNLARGNTQSGFDARGMLDCSFTGNVATNNGFYGLIVHKDASSVQSVRNIISGNDLSTNTDGGLYETDASDYNIITSNMTISNTAQNLSTTGTHTVVNNNISTLNNTDPLRGFFTKFGKSSTANVDYHGTTDGCTAIIWSTSTTAPTYSATSTSFCL